MANVDGPFGLALHQHNSKLPTELCFIPSTDSTAVFVGDAVKLAGSAGSIVGNPKKLTVAQAAAADPIYGVVVGFKHHWVASGMDLGRRHRPASTAMYAIVQPADPQDIWRIQADDVSETLADGDIGSNADIVVGSGDTVTGMSGMELDSDSAASTAGLQLKIVGYDDKPSNESEVANQVVLVRINQSQIVNDAGTTGTTAVGE